LLARRGLRRLIVRLLERVKHAVPGVFPFTVEPVLPLRQLLRRQYTLLKPARPLCVCPVVVPNSELYALIAHCNQFELAHERSPGIRRDNNFAELMGQCGIRGGEGSDAVLITKANDFLPDLLVGHGRTPPE